MTKRSNCRMTALLLALCIMLSLAACSKSEEYDLVFGDAGAENVLRICVDVGFRFTDEKEEYNTQKQVLSEFMTLLRNYSDLENVVFQLIPSSASERNIALSRLRTEIMSGYGPDVFILPCMGETDFTDGLIPYPQKSMENGIFLPLDTYMENNAQNTKWELQEQTILAAGRNAEGQQIIPLAYTFPLQTCAQSVLDIDTPDNLLTWHDTLHDPEPKVLYEEFVDCSNVSNVTGLNGTNEKVLGFEGYLPYILGDLADFKKEELLFTEEELMQRISEILERIEDEENGELSSFSEHYLGASLCSSSGTLLPLYSDDGGVTAELTYFAAINRNTKVPEDAYKVIDVLLRTETQLESDLYTRGICHPASNSAPLYKDTFKQEFPFDGGYYLDESTGEQLASIKQQITAVNFSGNLTSDLNTLLFDCYYADENGTTPEELVHQTYEQMRRRVKE